MKNLLTEEVKKYLFYGVLTTLVNYIVFAIGLHFMGEEMVLWVNMIAFVCAVLFAFVTNKLFVFQSEGSGWRQVLQEFWQFVFARLFSMGFEQAGLYVCVEWIDVSQYSLWGINALMIVKIVLSFISVLLNYIASKFVIFRSGTEG